MENEYEIRTLLEGIGSLGFVVTLGGSEDDLVFTAMSTRTGERFVVRGVPGCEYAAASELAQMVVVAALGD